MDSDQEKRSADASAKLPNPKKSVCVIVVEDDDAIRETLVTALDYEGYAVGGVRDGLEALEELKKHPHPALILLDMMMPRMGGLEFLRERKHSDILMGIPVVVMSASEMKKPPGDEVAAFFKKPIDLDLLLRVVDRYCEKGTPEEFAKTHEALRTRRNAAA